MMSSKHPLNLLFSLLIGGGVCGVVLLKKKNGGISVNMKIDAVHKLFLIRRRF
jgi:hypothetical protein